MIESKSPARRAARITAVLSAALLTSLAALPAGADSAEEQAILASVNVPSSGLSCGDAAVQARVTFKANAVPFAVKRVSVFVDGQGLPESSVEQAWPSVAVTHGLHPGRNLVEFIVYGDKDQSMDRKQTVLIGVDAAADDIAPAQIQCLGGVATAQAESGPPPGVNPDPEVNAEPAPPEPAPEVVTEVPPPVAETEVIEEPPPVYADGPVYAYYPAPVFFGPVLSLGFYGPPPVYYAPAPPLFVYNRWGPGYGYYYGYRGRGYGYGYGRPRDWGYDRGDHHDHWNGGGGSPPGGGHFGRPTPQTPLAPAGSAQNNFGRPDRPPGGFGGDRGGPRNFEPRPLPSSNFSGDRRPVPRPNFTSGGGPRFAQAAPPMRRDFAPARPAPAQRFNAAPRAQPQQRTSRQHGRPE